MYFPSIISTTLLSLSLFFLLPSTTHATPTPSLITTRDSYLTSITFPQLAHIASFRANLTDTDPPTEAQSRALELMQTVVAEFATDKLDEAEKACVEAFGRDVCFERITANYLRHDWGLGGGVKVDAVAVAVAAGDNWCGCATLSDYCKHGSCKLKKNSCWYQSYGCGFLLAVPCDGICG